MLIYKCNLCLREFKQKCHLDDHLNKKKKPCNVKKVIKETKPNSKHLKVPAKCLQNTCKIPAGGEKNTQPSEKLICPYCQNSFNRKDNLNKHIRDRCKNKKHIDNVDIIQSKINGTVYVSSEKYEKLREDNEKLIAILEDYKNFIKENNLIKQSIPSIPSVPPKNNYNIISNSNTTNCKAINNGTVNNGVVNNTTINNIVQFGKEDISKCDLFEMMNVYLKSTGGNIFPNMLKYINFNPKFPENFNILMSDHARENVKIHNGKKFITKKFKNVKGEILNSLSNHITNMCESYVDNPDTKKNNDVMTKMKINNISVKLINNDDITPLLTIKKKTKGIITNNKSSNSKEVIDTNSINQTDTSKETKNNDNNLQDYNSEINEKLSDPKSSHKKKPTSLYLNLNSLTDDQPNEPNEPTEPTEPTEPNEPSEPNKPNEPNEPNEPNHKQTQQLLNPIKKLIEKPIGDSDTFSNDSSDCLTDNSNDSSEYLDIDGEKKLNHYESKRSGLQEITIQKLKDELYNNKDMIENYHRLSNFCE
jgi:hypothetical protein